MKAKGFMLYDEQFLPLLSLTDAQLGKLLRAMFAHHNGEDVAIDDPVLNMAFGFLKVAIDKDSERYEQICEKRKIAGRKGGQNAQANASKCKQNEQMQAIDSKCEQIEPTTTTTTTTTISSPTPSSSKEDSVVVDVNTTNRVDSSEDSEKPSETKGIPNCPFKTICERFNERFAGRLPAVKIASPKRQAVVRQRWHDIFRDCGCHSEAEGLEAVNDYFDAIASHRWMFGENDRGWIANFDYIMSSRCYTKIYENSFHRKQVRR